MHRARYDLKTNLVALSPLHVGSGDFRTVENVKGKAGSNVAPEVGAIVRDCNHNPCLPATTLKGGLRRIGESILGEDMVYALFGRIKDEGMGQMGSLLFRGAKRIGEPPDVTLMPFADPARAFADRGCGPGVFVAARTKIDPKTGAADDAKLFHQEMVAAGTHFEFTIVLERRGTDKGAVEKETRELLDALRQILAEAKRDEGFALGKGRADGQGRMKVESVTVTKRRLAPNGGLEPEPVTDLDFTPKPGREDETLWTLTLECDGPFMILDSSWRPRPEHENDPQLRAQRVTANLPLLLGSSVTGALRARARWLARLEACRARSSGDGKSPEVDRDGHIVKSAAEARGLTPVERLFGVTGFRALLEVRDLQVTASQPYAITSVKLDRFSGAPIDGALYTSATFRGVKVKLRLALVRRPGAGEPSDADRDLAQKLIDDVRDNGLDLGHGWGKGFGWFVVEVQKCR